ncbi:DUF5672 family protein [Pedobacter sp. MW01-1-1]|uniref:DUF5672 family protein n=1 Tax=Pedobacter sp. MW01-1-1 TaxID=3383027 RepID=UPI003FEE4DD4
MANYPIIFVTPKSLDTDIYENECKEKVDFRLIRFNDTYFKNIAGYNSLMLSPMFYKHFLCYKYILVYQLDAFVFKDELLYWCSKNYDFIGAPHEIHSNSFGEIHFLKGYSRLLITINKLLRTKFKLRNVGNGGFSLRKTKSCYYLTKLLQRKIKSWGMNNEDGFFKYWGNLLHPFFKLPSDELALQFSIETNPAEALKELRGKLPFGCHAFEKYDPQTWATYIKIK